MILQIWNMEELLLMLASDGEVHISGHVENQFRLHFGNTETDVSPLGNF